MRVDERLNSPIVRDTENYLPTATENILIRFFGLSFTNIHILEPLLQQRIFNLDAQALLNQNIRILHANYRIDNGLP